MEVVILSIILSFVLSFNVINSKSVVPLLKNDVINEIAKNKKVVLIYCNCLFSF